MKSVSPLVMGNIEKLADERDALRADVEALAVAQELAVEAAHLALETVPDGGHRERVLTMIDRSNRAVLARHGVVALLDQATPRAAATSGICSGKS